MNRELRAKVTDVLREYRYSSGVTLVGSADALLASHPAGPDLREALREISKRLHYPDVKSDSGPVDVHRYMCDLMAITDAALAGHTEAGEWRGPWKCEKCGLATCDENYAGEVGWDDGTRTHFHVPGRKGKIVPAQCSGTLVPYERRKGG